MSNRVPTWAIAVEIRVISESGEYSTQPTLVLASSNVDIPCSIVGTFATLIHSSRFNPSVDNNITMIEFVTQDDEPLHRLKADAETKSWMISIVFLFGGQRMYLGTRYYSPGITSGMYLMPNEESKYAFSFGFTAIPLSVLLANSSILQELSFQAGERVEKIFETIKQNIQIRSDEVPALEHLKLKIASVRYEKIDNDVRIPSNIDVYNALRVIGSEGFKKYPVETIFRGNQVLFGGGLPFKEASQNYTFLTRAQVMGSIGSKRIVQPLFEWNEERSNFTPISQRRRSRAGTYKLIDQYAVSLDPSSLISGSIVDKEGEQYLSMGLPPEVYDSVKCHIFDRGIEVGVRKFIVIDTLIVIAEKDDVGIFPKISVEVFDYDQLYTKLTTDRADRAERYPDATNFTIKWNMIPSSNWIEEVRREIDMKVKEIETNSITTIQSYNDRDDLIKINKMGTSPQNAEDVLNNKPKNDTYSPSTLEVVNATPFAGDGYGMVIPRYKDQNTLIHHADRKYTPAFTGNQWWDRSQTIPPHNVGDFIIKTKDKKSQMLMSEDGDIVLEGQYVIIDASPSKKNNRPNTTKGIGAINDILLGKNATLKNARETDTIQIDSGTAPINMMSLVMLCTMFGLPFSSPMVGKITGGSQKVKSE